MRKFIKYSFNKAFEKDLLYLIIFFLFLSFILGQFRDERVDHDLEVTSELILIARILHQRFKINNGIKVKEDKSVTLARDEVLKEIKNDEYFDLIKNFIKDYRQFRDKNVN